MSKQKKKEDSLGVVEGGPSLSWLEKFFYGVWWDMTISRKGTMGCLSLELLRCLRQLLEEKV